MLAVECDDEAAQALCRRIREALEETGVAASLALGRRGPHGLAGAVGEAFASLELHKRGGTPARVG